MFIPVCEGLLRQSSGEAGGKEVVRCHRAGAMGEIDGVCVAVAVRLWKTGGSGFFFPLWNVAHFLFSLLVF